MKFFYHVVYSAGRGGFVPYKDKTGSLEADSIVGVILRLTRDFDVLVKLQDIKYEKKGGIWFEDNDPGSGIGVYVARSQEILDDIFIEESGLTTSEEKRMKHA